jgi:hypothetical protein
MDWLMPLLPFGLGLIQKHVIRRLPNDVIPYVNTAVTIGGYGLMTGDWGAAVDVGLKASGVATLAHQAIKAPIRYKTGLSP